MPPFPSPRSVEVFAPATVANLGPGFDILGLALAEPYDTIIAERRDEPGVCITSITGDGGRLPLEADKNTAGIAASCILNQLGIRDSGVCLSITKGLPLESGLGSSAASAAGAAVAVNALFGNPLTRHDLLSACVEGEAAVSGRHADNVAPALLGGIVLITDPSPAGVFKLPTPPDLVLALVTPDVSVPTAEARAVLPQTIPLRTYVQQSAVIALLVSAIYRGDVALMAQAMAADQIIEPARAHLMPGLPEVRKVARAAGALATVISGAGPTLCAICNSSNVARLVADEMAAVYAVMGIPAATRVTTPSLDGVTLRVLEP
ncbi:MAG: homoserine kinase [Anaerolineae bacterium]|nr:homoserine kinase [Anaerolineae bacterium]